MRSIGVFDESTYRFIASNSKDNEQRRSDAMEAAMLGFSITADAPAPSQASSAPALPARRQSEGAGSDHAALSPRLLAATLDEIDYGLVLLDASAGVLYLNHGARAELQVDHPLEIRDSKLMARYPWDSAPLRDAIDGALQRGLRRMVTIGDVRQRTAISVVPMRIDERSGGAGALLVFGKREVCEELSVDSYARGSGLTPAETRVLKLLYRGLRPNEIASRHGVALSTVRSQIGSIRSKTDVQSISGLLRKVASLPPMVSALRQRGSASGNDRERGAVPS